MKSAIEQEPVRQKVIVYHGGTERIEHPLARMGREGLDFGRVFYVTDLRQQAEGWALRMARIRNVQGVVNVYELDIERVKQTFAYHHFDKYDEAWLMFIVQNRNGSYQGEQYDMVEGGVADDRVIDTVEAYMAELMPLDMALRNLSEHRPNNQMCIRTQRVIDECLRFVESYQI